MSCVYAGSACMRVYIDSACVYAGTVECVCSECVRMSREYRDMCVYVDT